MIALALWLAGALGITGNVLNMILNSSFWINKSLSFFFKYRPMLLPHILFEGP